MVSPVGRKFPRMLALAMSITTCVAVVLTATLIGRTVRSSELSELIHSLTTQATLIENQVDKSAFLATSSTVLHDLAHRLDKSSGCRVTFLAADGRVLGDSSVSFDDLRRVENHKDRPEVRDALASGAGHATRFSSTIHEDFLYVAVKVDYKDATVGLVRLALPLTELKKRQRTLSFHIASLSLAALALIVFVAVAVSGPLSRPVTEISQAADHLADQAHITGKALSHDRAHLAAILSHMEEGVAAVDRSGRITAVNPAISSMFGLRAEEAVGKFFLEAIRQGQLNQLIQDVLRDLRVRTDEVRAFAPDERIFEVHAAPLMQKGQCQGALLVLHDITRLRRLEQIRSDFVANVSHELRTPLSSIKGFAETLRTGALKDPAVAVEFLSSIEKHTDNMTALVEDLLDLTAIESGQRVPVQEPVALAEAVADVVKGLAPIAAKGKIRIESALAPDVPEVVADRGHLKQILANLLENAIKFNREDGWVKIQASRNGDRIELVVADSGSGIPAQDLPRIFERFYRVDKARSRSMGGTGLGLAIVKHLVEANGGLITVESAVGHGSTFRISFPLS